MSADQPAEASATPPPDPFALLRSRGYLALLLMAAILGVPISAAAYGFLALVSELESLTYTDLPKALGFEGTPPWWPVPLVAVGGLLVGLTIRYLPGTAGHKPAEGLSTAGAPRAVDLPGIVIAAVLSLGAGAVLGPEAPLIAIGSGFAVAAVRLAKRDLAPNTISVVGAAGSFAAVSALLGSPILGAFLLMEVSGLGGPMLGMVLVPGLLAAGIGSLIFVGLGTWTGLGTYSLALQDVPHADQPDLAEFGWAIVLGLAAALVGVGIRRLGLLLQGRVERRLVLATTVAGAVVGALALAYAEGSGQSASEVLYSGQSALNPLLAAAPGYSAGTLTLLIVCKSLAYGISMSGFRGGPVFPSMFVGAAGGILFSHLPGLSLASGFAMGIGAMCVAMLRLPMTSVLLATLLMGTEGLTVMPLVIVSVVVAYVASTRLTPVPAGPPEPAGERAAHA
ncbi:chloride channel protein [Kitasatospora sp. NPDC050543]|uniref:chloride channel protein n=1 Tax=Kitasatospora sp. NPDC050543 TaxID=3364054 RepID=UPI0037A8AD82